MDMNIVITTLGRPERQVALRQIPEELHEKVYVFTEEAYADELAKHIPLTVNLRTLPDDTDGIAQTRQRAIEALPKGKVWIIDDLCRFKKKHHINGKPSNKVVEPHEFIECYELIESLLDNYFQVALSPQFGNHGHPQQHRPIGRAYSCYGLRTDIMERANIRFDGMYQRNPEVKFMEDFYITMDGLTKGYPNTVVYDFCFEYHHNTDGGNSLNRTLDGHAQSAIALSQLFPGCIKLVKKEGSWGKIKNMDSRIEIRASWKKAFEQGRKKRR